MKLSKRKLVGDFVSQESYLIHRFFDGYIDFNLLVIKLRDNLDKLILEGGDLFEK